MTDEAANSVADQPRDTLSTAQRTLLIKSASYASLCVALSLVLLKAWGWQETASVSLLSSLADSILDVFASAITFWAVRYSLSPADADHRFGHGKSEGLAAPALGSPSHDCRERGHTARAVSAPPGPCSY